MAISFSADDRACTVIGPDGQKIRILFGNQSRGHWGKTRFRLHDAGPMHIKEAFLGGEGKHVILTVVPEGWTGAAEEEVENAAETTRAKPIEEKARAKCELCKEEDAEFFACLDEEQGEWSFVGFCKTAREPYWVPFKEFFGSADETVDWMAHLSEKTWFKPDKFFRMMRRLRGAMSKSK